MFYRKCEVKNLFACVFIYNQKGAMPDSIPFAIKSPSLNGMKFKHKRESLCLVFYLYTLHDVNG